MCPMMLNSLSDGPAMILSPPQEHAFLQFPRHSKLDVVSQNSGSFFSSGPSTSFGAKLAASGPVGGKPSRKRSRDEAAFEEAMNAPSVPSMPAPAPAKKEEPIYGEGMVLLNPRTGLAISAETQTGTWYEETLESSAASAPSVSSHSQAFQSSQSSISGRKSQRLDPSAPRLDDIALSSVQRLQDSGKDDNRRLFDATNRSPDEPLVDDATRLLGISWQRITFDGDGDMAAAVRGWKKYIDKQYSAYLLDSQILMKNRALNAYLVAARPVTPFGPANSNAFFLFNDDLTQAQLVASAWDSCIQNLRSNPIVFEGTQILNAAHRSVNSASLQTQNILGANPANAGLPLLQTLSAQPVSNGVSVGLNGGVGMGTGMDIDA
ncbi:hypothetical protein BDV32DRAFT_60770 [Aspergillus pseudonomiae]|uniref:Uncharacterized protein n=1 Tax=Aspergillus pseudonomiae TaxID=1506151 RepID=A0A5N6HXR5_9EURO|nr:uncharacterized protein BDV37DRAFT_104430 [Aspergillus pseudonomiae]KAB8259196.1 hypothetical protein BDV32DRAFT_60770 [Aspergillus pseudonomiae]KAE8404696.1 hypothetical protein BDV37DRAFT_104430 [Aspergillus pseudonomiae]